MNIDEYRALKAKQEEEIEDAQTQQGTDGTETSQQEETTQGSVETQTNTEQAPPEQVEKVETKEEPKPITVDIDGQEVTLEELKNGYLRQSDYTRKTQEAKRKEKQAEEALEFIKTLQQNPDVAQQLSQQFDLPNLDPNQAKAREYEDLYYDLLIRTEIDKLQSKYGEFDVEKVLTTARDNNINDLETAYLVVNAREGGGLTKEVDKDKLKEEIRAELLKELKAQEEAKVDTSTLITTKSEQQQISDNTPKLSAQEKKVAKAMGMSEKDYATWRDAGRKRK